MRMEIVKLTKQNVRREKLRENCVLCTIIAIMEVQYKYNVHQLILASLINLFFLRSVSLLYCVFVLNLFDFGEANLLCLMLFWWLLYSIALCHGKAGAVSGCIYLF